MYDSINELLRRILPLESTLDSEIMADVSGDIKDACRQLYEYKIKMYNCFLSNPEKYFLNIDEKMLNVYGFFVEQLVMNNDVSSRKFSLSENELDLCLEGHHKGLLKILKKHNITFKDKISPLSDFGWSLSEKKGVYTISNTIYPQIMLAANLLVNSARKAKGNYYHYFIRSLDYRILARPTHLQTAYDIIRLLPENFQPGAKELYEYIEQQKLKGNPYTVDHISFTVKSKNVCSLRRDHFYIPLGNEYEANSFIEICKPAMQKFIFKHLNYCTNCTLSHNGGAKYRLLEKNVAVCSEMGIRIKNFDEKSEIETAKNIIDMSKNKILSYS